METRSSSASKRARENSDPPQAPIPATARIPEALLQQEGLQPAPSRRTEEFRAPQLQFESDALQNDESEEDEEEEPIRYQIEWAPAKKSRLSWEEVGDTRSESPALPRGEENQNSPNQRMIRAWSVPEGAARDQYYNDLVDDLEEQMRQQQAPVPPPGRLPDGAPARGIEELRAREVKIDNPHEFFVDEDQVEEIAERQEAPGPIRQELPRGLLQQDGPHPVPPRQIEEFRAPPNAAQEEENEDEGNGVEIVYQKGRRMPWQ